MTPSTPRVSAKGQAMAPATIPFGAEAFGPSDTTTLRWLGMAGFVLNSSGTTVAIDAVLHGFDMPLLIDVPVRADQVPHLDAFLATHIDNDHFSIPTGRALIPVTAGYYSTRYVADVMRSEGMPATGFDIGASFTVGNVTVTLTPADHAWQNARPRPGQRHFDDADACGFWIETPHGTIWAPGDSRLIPDHHLTMPAPDVMLFDFSDNAWHFTFEGAVRMANAYPETDLVLHHWGSVDSPDFSPFNADPAALTDVVVNPERIRILAPGEPFLVAAR